MFATDIEWTPEIEWARHQEEVEANARAMEDLQRAFARRKPSPPPERPRRSWWQFWKDDLA